MTCFSFHIAFQTKVYQACVSIKHASLDYENVGLHAKEFDSSICTVIIFSSVSSPHSLSLMSAIEKTLFGILGLI